MRSKRNGLRSVPRDDSASHNSPTSLNEPPISLNFASRAPFGARTLRTYALALDGAKSPCRVHASNAGQVLRSGVASKEHAALVSDLMLSPVFFSGWGIRTIADTERRYNPMSYHNGSIWPHDNAIIAAGIARYGRRDKAGRIFDALCDAASLMDQSRSPELFCGFRRRRGRAPILYPVACSPQAWASGAVFLLLQSVLGLEIDGHEQVVRFRQPTIPARLKDITLRRLSVGSSLIDVNLSRARDGAVKLDVMAGHGSVRIEML